MRICNILLAVVFLLTYLPGICSADETVTSGTFEENEYLIYVPEGLAAGERYPLIVGFSPSANAKDTVATWRGHADNHKCIILASKIIKNGMDIPNYLNRLRNLIHERVAVQYSIRPDRIIAVGTSGGGMASHLFSFFHPDTVAAVITSVGYIHENSLKHKDTYPRGKVCAFLTSPTDFNYKLMQEDRKFLKSLDWQIKWYEFEGGHRTAPEEIREEALTWVLEALSQ
ncbi:MAG: hypothetical protein CVV41_10215 [Candidatus Riflebacteria bacterium HGW-Riflebacteria-1]|jgi:hypothetical protein|nr:MAG: hypothetical protein CVV41_10215 [Candidatus Riflebacteria bacterium HGW-Riflebacteria-1]